MKILVYGMQSSGASLFTFFLAQKPKTFAIVDLLDVKAAPKFKDSIDNDIVIKCMITNKITLSEHLKNFKPDKTILFIRNPADNYASLKTKPYVNGRGFIDDKFKALEETFKNRQKFDLVIFYEVFILNPSKVLKELKKINFEVKRYFFEFKRTKEDISKFNLEHKDWCGDSFRNRLSFGNIHFHAFASKTELRKVAMFKTTSKKERGKVRELCPSLYKFYEERFQHILRPKIIDLLKSNYYTKKRNAYKIIDRNIGKVGILLKSEFPGLYYLLKRLK